MMIHLCISFSSYYFLLIDLLNWPVRELWVEISGPERIYGPARLAFRFECLEVIPSLISGWSGNSVCYMIYRSIFAPFARYTSFRDEMNSSGDLRRFRTEFSVSFVVSLALFYFSLYCSDFKGVNENGVLVWAMWGHGLIYRENIRGRLASNISYRSWKFLFARLSWFFSLSYQVFFFTTPPFQVYYLVTRGNNFDVFSDPKYLTLSAFLFFKTDVAWHSWEDFGRPWFCAFCSPLWERSVPEYQGKARERSRRAE